MANTRNEKAKVHRLVNRLHVAYVLNDNALVVLRYETSLQSSGLFRSIF